MMRCSCGTFPAERYGRHRAPGLPSANFQLRKDRQETGVSVTRQAITSAARLLRLVRGDTAAGSRVDLFADFEPF